MEEDKHHPAFRECPDDNGRCTLAFPSHDEVEHAPNCDCKYRTANVVSILADAYGRWLDGRRALERQRQGWDRSAQAWAKWDGFLMEWLRPVADAILEAACLKEDYRVLDVGCGTGGLGLIAAAKVVRGEVIGVDFAEGMVQVAGRKAESLAIKNYKAQVAEASQLPFEENTFDTVLGRHAVMLFQNRESGVKGLARVLKPRGRLVLSSWGPMDRNPWMTVGIRAIESVLGLKVPMSDGLDGPGPFQCSESKTLKSLFTKADIANKYTVSEITGEVAFESSEHYWRFLSQVIGRVASALRGEWKDKRHEIRRAVVRAAMEHVRDGRLTFGWSALVAGGSKPRRRPFPPMRLHVQWEDCNGRVWHEHKPDWPGTRTEDAPAGKPPSSASR